MPTDPAKDLVIGYIQSEGVESTARYVSRGRAYRDMTDEELLSAWVKALKAWVANQSEGPSLDDLASEMVLRNLTIPMARMVPELAEIQRKLAAMGPFSEEAEQDFTNQLAAYVQAKERGSN